MKEKTRIFVKGLAIGTVVTAAAAIFEAVKTNGIPATKQQWIAVLGLGLVAGGTYAKITLMGKIKDEETE